METESGRKRRRTTEIDGSSSEEAATSAPDGLAVWTRVEAMTSRVFATARSSVYARGQSGGDDQSLRIELYCTVLLVCALKAVLLRFDFLRR